MTLTIILLVLILFIIAEHIDGYFWFKTPRDYRVKNTKIWEAPLPWAGMKVYYKFKRSSP